MNLNRLRQEYTTNERKLPGVCCGDVLTLIDELELHKRALELAAAELSAFKEYQQQYIARWLSQAAE